MKNRKRKRCEVESEENPFLSGRSMNQKPIEVEVEKGGWKVVSMLEESCDYIDEKSSG